MSKQAFSYTSTRMRTVSKEGGELEVSISFDAVLISLKEVDVVAFKDAVNAIRLRVGEENGNRKFVMAPAAITKQFGSNWKTICWIEEKDCYGARHGPIYWEISSSEMDEVLYLMDIALGVQVLH